jgi:hypothetical protein
MGTSIERELNEAERARLPVAREEMTQVGTRGCATKFTYFVAFDGTNNNPANLPLSGSPYPTNISHLKSQADEAAEHNPNIRPRYFAGVGTGGDQGHGVNAAVYPSPAIEAAAQKAYAEFSDAAFRYLKTQPGATPADIGTAVAGLSRGCATAIRFAQTVHEQGLKGPDGEVLIAKGQLPVTAMALIDPVDRFVTQPMDIPPNVQGQVLSVIAEHENRADFRAMYLARDPRVSEVRPPGNHVGNGGGYEPHGTAAALKN